MLTVPLCLQLECIPYQTCLPDLIDDVVTAYGLMASFGVRFFSTIDDNVPEWVSVDSLRIRQIIANGVTNALKYTPSGQVQLHVRLPVQRR